MANRLKHAAERKAFEVLLDSVGKKAINNREEGYVQFVDQIEKALGDTWKPVAYQKLRETFSKDGKWTQFFNRLIDYVDLDFLKGIFMSFAFEGGMGFREVQKNSEKAGTQLPWVILFDPTSACNLHCTGCWASEYSRQLNLSYEDMDRIVTEGKAYGCHLYVMTGGEPTVRQKDIFRLAKKHSDCGFMLFTNGTMINQAFCDEMKACRNILLSISIEGMEETTDARRGPGVFRQVMQTMDLLHDNGLIYGVSICYTSENCRDVTSDDFMDFLISKGVTYGWYFHYMPTGMDGVLDLMPTPEQREYMYHRIREIRGFEGGKPIFMMDFQNDGQWVGGCVAGGRCYCHINPNGDVEPCVFIHYSSANIHEQSLMDCLTQPLFREYHAGQPFHENLLRPCPFLENPELLQAMVKRTGARSTDMVEPESAEHLCEKVRPYAAAWKPVADKLWKSDHPDYIPD